ncbi:MAG: hypothetical protein M1541_13775 [Acidobacteria bacterium]|nr:hypothetical protein [Acidobacteriota bacterium]
MLALLLLLAMPDLAQLEHMMARFAPVKMQVDTSALAPGDRKALAKLIEAARVLDGIYMSQLWSGNHALYAKLKLDTTPLGKARLRYFWINKGPWSDLDAHEAFLPGVPPRKLPGANFYPEDITRAEFEAWVKTLSAPDRKRAEGFFTVIRRDPARKLTIVPYSREYRADLERCAALLREAAALTPNQSLRRFLTLRADAFLSDDYYASDIAWMDLDAPLDITIGPYETYTDELFGYKAAFEAYVNVRDDRESARLAFFGGHLQQVENNLPVEPRFRNPKLGALAPIRVVNQVFNAGDAAHGVQAAAYNLPNDERVILQKGSKRVMLKNVQQAKFRRILTPIAGHVLPASARPALRFDAFFTHIVAHELAHGLGPHQAGNTSVRQALKDLYSPIEEAKADVTGLYMLPLIGGQAMQGFTEAQLYTTYLASCFRSVRFGLNEAHGRGTALQFNYFMDKGAFLARPDGAFAADPVKMRAAVRDLCHDLLTIEAHGDYAAAKRLLESLAVIRPPMQKALDGLRGIPVDIEFQP